VFGIIILIILFVTLTKIIKMIAANANKKHQLSKTKYCTQSGLLTHSVCLHLQENLTTWALPDFFRLLCAWSNYAIKLIM